MVEWTMRMMNMSSLCFVGRADAPYSVRARDAIAECRRENVAPFLKQWGSYTNNPLVVEEGRTVQEAMQSDPPENGKGGGKLDGKLCREFPSAQNRSTSVKGRVVKDACAGRALLAG